MLTMIYCLIAAKQNYEKQKKFYIFILFGESEVLIQTFDVKIHLPQNKYHLHCDLGVKYIPTCQESYKKKLHCYSLMHDFYGIIDVIHGKI